MQGDEKVDTGTVASRWKSRKVMVQRKKSSANALQGRSGLLIAQRQIRPSETRGLESVFRSIKKGLKESVEGRVDSKRGGRVSRETLAVLIQVYSCVRPCCVAKPARNEKLYAPERRGDAKLPTSS